MIKLAILFLFGMVVLALFMARPKRKDGGGGWPRLRRRGKGGRVAEARRCPDCGAFVVDGEACPCQR